MTTQFDLSKYGNVIDGFFKHCGHEATNENIFLKKTGYIACKNCIRDNRRFHSRKSALKKAIQGAMI